MNRLWIRLSLAFSTVVLLSVALILGISLFLAQLSDQQRHMDNRYEGQGGLSDHLADFYRQHQGWEGVDAFFAGAEGARAPWIGDRFKFVLTDANGQTIYSTRVEDASILDTQPSDVTQIVVDGQTRGQLTVTRPLPGLQPDFLLARLNSFLIVVAVVGGVLGITFGVSISRSLTAPLNRLAAAAQAIGKRDLTRRVDVAGSAEIMAVAQAFNEMAAALDQAETMRRNLVADVAHELRTPLTVLQGNLRAILDNVYPLEQAEVMRLYDQTRLLSRLVNDLHELTLAESHQLPLNLQPTDITEMMRNTAATFGAIAEAEGVTLRTEIPAQLPKIVADPVRLAQVLHNLLINALRHTAEGGTICLSAQADDHTLRIIVQDTGEGIEPEHLPHLFERFYRADRARSRETGGTGLGLAIVRAIVEAHGANITASSEGVGRGATFTISWTI